MCPPLHTHYIISKTPNQSPKKKEPTMATLLILSAFLCAAAASTQQQQGPASASAPAMPMPESPDCTSALLNVSSCLSYVEEGSNVRAPEKGCCSGLSGLVSNSPVCLCQLLAGSSSAYGLQIDTAKALSLPAVCKVDTPPVSLCSVFGIPVASPTGPDVIGSSIVGVPVGSPQSVNGGSRSFSAISRAWLAGVLLCVGIVSVIVLF